MGRTCCIHVKDEKRMHFDRETIRKDERMRG
jgi:hypothetical protein